MHVYVIPYVEIRGQFTEVSLYGLCRSWESNIAPWYLYSLNSLAHGIL